jgi:DNA modification methylase
MLTIKPGDCRDVLRAMPDQSVHCCVTSPPYFGLRDYGTRTWKGGDPTCDHKGDKRYYTEKTAGVSSSGAFSQPGEANKERLKNGRWREGGTCRCGAIHHDPQIGLEPTPDAYVAELVAVFREVRRVLRDDGTLWLNLGDSYSGSGKGAWNVPDERKANVKETYRPNVNPSKFRPGSGRADGVVDERGQRNRDGIGPVQGLKPKDLIGIPWRVAFALQADGWYLRQDIIWSKPNPMPESVTDRCTKAHEYIFLMSKRARYFYDAAAIAEPNAEVDRPQSEARRLQRMSRNVAAVNGNGQSSKGIDGGLIEASHVMQTGMTRNKRSVWEVSSQPFAEAHFATFPPDLIEPCIKAGCPKGGTVLDPFGGAGTTGLVADRLGRNAILIELNPEYAAMTERRIRNDAGMFTDVEVSP